MNMGSDLLFLEAEDVIRIHDRVLSQEPGLKGTKVEKVEGIIGRVKSRYSYSSDINTAFDLAAYYAEAIARGHGFNDANKRTAFIVMITILEINNVPLPEKLTDNLLGSGGDYASVMVNVADGSLKPEQLSQIISLIYVVGLTGVGIGKVASMFAKWWKG